MSRRFAMKPRLLRWVPAVAVPAVIVVGVLAVPLQAGAAVDLPDKTPQEVLALLSSSTVDALSGTIEQTSALGLPDLGAITGGSATGGASTDDPASDGSSGSTDAASAATSALELLTGSHTARVFVDGATKTRVQVMDRLAERDLVRNGDDLWLYDSDLNAATHVVIPADAHPDATKDGVLPGSVTTPSDLAQQFLARIDASTAVTVGEDTDLAGRTAYNLILTPDSAGTLVGSVSISVDSETGLPLRVSVEAKGQKDPAFEVGFTEITVAAPSADLFSFTPPAGATVKEQALPDYPSADKAAPDTTAPTTDAPATPTSPPVVAGTAWDSVVELPAATVPASLASSPLLAQVTTAVTGGRLLSTALVNVLLTDDGRVFAGSVPLERLQSVASAQ